MKGKIFSVLLTLCLLFTLIPMTVFAAENEKEFSFVVWDSDDNATISGGTGSIKILHEDGTFGASYELKETTVTEEDFTYSKYAITVDVTTLVDSDYFMLTWVCEGYEPIVDDAEMILEDDYYSSLGPVSYWKECEYSCDEYVLETIAWDDTIRAWNEHYMVYEADEGLAIEYDSVWDETAFMEALQFVGANEKISSLWLGYAYDGIAVPKLSANAMSSATKDNPSMYYSFDAENMGFMAFDSIKGTSEFGIDLTKTINDSVKKRFEEENIDANALTLNITGNATFTGAYLEIDMSGEFADIFTVPADKIQGSDDYKEGSTYVYVVKYDAKKNDFDYCGHGTYTYRLGDTADGKPTYTLTIQPQEIPGGIDEVFTEGGSYTIIDVDLPLHMYFGENEVVDNINTSMTTEEVTTTVTDAITNVEDGKTVEVALPKAMNIGADAMQKAKDTATPIVVAVAKTEDNSYVNWSFAKIDNPVEFNPAVHVDATVAAVDTKLAAVELPTTLKMTTVSFEFDGTLPGEAKVTLDMANSDLGITNTAEGTAVYLYYYNPTTNLFELIDESAVTDGYVTFKMTHCSDYVVTSEKLPAAATTAQTPPAGDNGGTDNGTTDNGATDNGTTNNGTTDNGVTGETTPTSPATGDVNVFVWCVVFMFVCATVLVLRKRIVK